MASIAETNRTQVVCSHKVDDARCAFLEKLFFTPLTHELYDVGRWRAGQEPRDVFEMDPTAFGNFVARTSLGAARYFTGENVMVFLLATKVEEILR